MTNPNTIIPITANVRTVFDRGVANIRAAVDAHETNVTSVFDQLDTNHAAAQAALTRLAQIVQASPNQGDAQAVFVAQAEVDRLAQQGQAAAAQGDVDSTRAASDRLAAIAARATPQAAPASAAVVPQAAPAPAPAVATTQPAPTAAPTTQTAPASNVAAANGTFNWFAPAQGQQAPARNTDPWAVRVEDGINTLHERANDLNTRISALEHSSRDSVIIAIVTFLVACGLTMLIGWTPLGGFAATLLGVVIGGAAAWIAGAIYKATTNH